MARFFLALAGLLLGVAAGGLIAFFGGIWVGDILKVSQMEGAYAMGVAFVITPIGMQVGGLLGLIGGIWWGWRRSQ